MTRQQRNCQIAGTTLPLTTTLSARPRQDRVTSGNCRRKWSHAIIVGKLDSGDVNEDGVVILLEVGAFNAVLSSSGFHPNADMNQDPIVNVLEIDLFGQFFPAARVLLSLGRPWEKKGARRCVLLSAPNFRFSLVHDCVYRVSKASLYAA